jgi:hypothetical protein
VKISLGAPSATGSNSRGSKTAFGAPPRKAPVRNGQLRATACSDLLRGSQSAVGASLRPPCAAVRRDRGPKSAAGGASGWSRRRNFGFLGRIGLTLAARRRAAAVEQAQQGDQEKVASAPPAPIAARAVSATAAQPRAAAGRPWRRPRQRAGRPAWRRATKTTASPKGRHRQIERIAADIAKRILEWPYGDHEKLARKSLIERRVAGNV